MKKQTWFVCLLISFFIFGLCGVAQAADYYVDVSTGDNGNTGTLEGLAWKNVSYAVTQATTAGDIINVASGNYNAATGETFPFTVRSGVHLKSTTPHGATIDAGAIVQDAISMEDSSTLEGFTLAFSCPYPNVKYMLYIAGNNAEVKNNIFNRSGAQYSIYIIGSNALISGNTVTATGSGLYLVYINGPGSSINNNIINYSAATMGGLFFTSDSDGFTVQGNTIETAANYPIRTSYSDNATIEGNTITCNSNSTAMTLQYSINCTVQNNKVVSPGSAGYGIHFYNTSGSCTTNEVRGFAIGIYAKSIGDTEETDLDVNKNTIVKNTTGVQVATYTTNLSDNIICAAPSLNGFLEGSVGIYKHSGTVNEDYNNLFNNETHYSGTFTQGEHDQLTEYPRFVDPDNDDYRLFNDSPCPTWGAYPTIGADSGITSESYVSGTGNDTTGDGTVGAPFRSITHALSTTIGTVHVMEGTYNSGAGESFPISLIPGTRIVKYGTGIATVNAGSTAQHMFYLRDSCTLEGLTLTSYYSGVKYTVYIAGNNAHLKNNIFNRNGDEYCIYTIGSNSLISGNTINATGAGSYCLNINGPSPSITNNTINCNTSSYSLYFNTDSDGFTLQGNTIEGSSLYRLIYTNQSDNGTIDGNTITYNGEDKALAPYNSVNCTVSNNKIVGPGSSGTYGIYFSNTSGSCTTNEVRGFATGIYADSIGDDANTDLDINKNTIVKNYTGVRVHNDTTNLYDNIISAAPSLNSFLDYGLGIYRVSGTVNEDHNNLFNNTDSYYGTFTRGEHDQLTEYPRFVDPDNNDYRLCDDSPCKTAASDGTYMGAYAATGVDSGILSESYVSGSGNDTTGDGTVGAPFRSITQALSTTEGTVHVMAGTYNSVGGESFPITLASGSRVVKYGAGTATVNAGDTAEHVFHLGGACTLEGFTLISSYSGRKYIVCIAGNNAEVKNNIFNRSGDEYCIYTYGSNSLISGNIINASGGGYDCIYIAGPSSLITNNTINCATAEVGLYFSSPYSEGEERFKVIMGGIAASDGFILRGNTVEGSSAYLVCPESNETSTIEGNTITYSGTNAAVTFWNCPGSTLSNNKIIGPGSSGTYGIYYYNSLGRCITNEVRGFETGIYAGSGGSALEIDKMTIVKNTYGAIAGSGTTWLTNSIIANDPEDDGGTGGAAGSIGLYATGLKGAGSIGSWNNDVYGCETLYDGVTVDTGDISLEAQFINAANNDFRLQASSPCIDAGNSDPYYDDPDGTTADMGAYYYHQADFTGPIVDITSPTSSTKWKGGGTENITWTLTDVTGITANSINIYYSTDNGSSYPYWIGTNEADDGTFAWTLPSIDSSTVKVKITALDASPVQSLGTGESGSFTIDSTDPSAPTLKTPSDESYVNDDTPTFTWEAPADNLTNIASYEITIDSLPTIIATQGAVTSYTPSSALSEGSHTWKVRARDNAGNWGAYSLTWNIIVDVTAPALQLISPEGGEVIAGLAEEPYSIKWSASDNIGLADDPVTIYFSSNEGWSVIESELPNSGEYSWDVPDINSTTCRIRIEAKDCATNVGSAVCASNFTIDSSPPEADSIAPGVVIRIAGLAIKSGDHIGRTPKFDITLTDNISLDALSVKVVFDGNTVSPSIVFSTAAEMEVRYEPGELAEGDHTIRVEVSDTAENPASKEIADLKVSGAGAKAQVIGAVVSYPTTFSPARDKVCIMAFNLNKDENTSIHMSGPAGGMVWNRKFSAGVNGGKAGYNEVEFSGISDMTGAPLANGIYVYKIIVGNEVIAKGYIVIFEQIG